ncbi:MAG TPA: bifunctional hydroxymethylpyrimidine kinase/phosphomethylpyrimidine kinase [Acidimicrobiales bacterium]|nr:bifunctional hydroxymethylpyrimidine kinase/phosphomethylpyrimidine kinase [Acidimicrobiales bacterium]
MSPPPVALTIAGSDSGGGAGIQADLKTFAALRVFGASALAALTAQNTMGVREVHVVPPDFVVAQVEAVLDDLPVAAVKTGMLATAEIVDAVAGLAAAGELPNLVVDPVMVSSTGHRLLDERAVVSYRERLFAHARVVTPNLREAEVLVGRELPTLDDVRAAAADLRETGCEVVVIKGGHPTADSGDEAIDIWFDGSGPHELRGPRVATENNHGTGCSFASAIVARLAHGDDVPTALATAKVYVARGLAGGIGWRIGAGHGPIDHFGWEAERTGENR